MDTLEFFKSVWPAQGNYCIARLFQKPEMKIPAWHHIPCKTIEDAVATVKKSTDENWFFTVHTCKQPYREDTDGKLNFNKTGPKRYYREHDNMLESRAFFFDLDVGENDPKKPPKYATRQEALDGLTRFLFLTGLPVPLVTSSGGGFHVYWCLQDPLPSGEWRSWAAVLHHIARRMGLKADPARTTDQSSVLRVVGTLNIKPGREARPCVALQAGVTTPVQVFLDQLTEILGDDRIPDEVRYPRHTEHGARKGNLHVGWTGDSPTLEEVSEVCEHVRNYAETGHTRGNEPTMYYLGCGIVSKTQDGYEHMHNLAAIHPDYDTDTANAKLEQFNAKSEPTTCIKLDQICGGDACARCPFSKLGKNPLLIALERRKRKPPPGSVTEDEIVPEVEPPYPWTRKNGGIYKLEKTKGEEGQPSGEEETCISTYDMFPIENCARTLAERAFQVWALRLPHEPLVTVKIPSDILADPKQTHSLLLDYGMQMPPNASKKVHEFMFYYMKTLQDRKRANRQYDHLGWVDQDRAEFILPTEVIASNGTSAPCRLAASAVQEVGYVSKKGTLEESIELLKFYNKPQYLRHQFMIMCGLGSVLFHATGHSGVVINASGDTGGSKSSALYAAGSLWGRPTDYVMSGLQQGMTTLSRLHRVHTLCQLPACMDEITLMEPDAAKEFVLNSTQPNRRRGLKPDGTPRQQFGGKRSNMLLCSANTSLHNLLQMNNKAGTAGDMRVYEIAFPELPKDPVEIAAAKRFLRQIEEKHYGHIGPAFVKNYMMSREAYDEVVAEDESSWATKFELSAPERYWSAGNAAGLTAGQLAWDWGLLPFDPEPVRKWAYGEQLAAMRGVVHEAEVEAGPSSVISAFLNDKSGNTVVLSGRPIEGNTYQQPMHDVHGAVVVHHDVALKTAWVRKDAFKIWCNSHSHNGVRVLSELFSLGVVTDTEVRFVLGKDTKYAMAEAVCFVVDLTKVKGVY